MSTKGIPKTLNDCMNFGKYKDKTVQWVLDNDPSYIIWAIKNVPTFIPGDDVKDYHDFNVRCDNKPPFLKRLKIAIKYIFWIDKQPKKYNLHFLASSNRYWDEYDSPEF